MVRHGHMTGNCTYSTRRKPTGVVTRPGSRLATGGRFLLPRRYSTQSPTLPGITNTSPSITNPLPAPAHCQHQPVASTNPLPDQPYASRGIPARVPNMSSRLPDVGYSIVLVCRTAHTCAHGRRASRGVRATACAAPDKSGLDRGRAHLFNMYICIITVGLPS